MDRVILRITQSLLATIMFTGCDWVSQSEKISELESRLSELENEISDGKEPSNNFKEVRIGNQVWMAENLNLDRFRNGDPIPHVKSAIEWKRAGEMQQPAWCYYDNDPANGEKYGKLYNWYAVVDDRGLAPKGWHIPSDEEWTTLTDYLGGEEIAGYKMKSTSGWAENGNGTNESGFSGLPGSVRYPIDGSFLHIGEIGYWWSSTPYGDSAFSRALFSNKVYASNTIPFAKTGCSVRCLKD